MRGVGVLSQHCAKRIVKYLKPLKKNLKVKLGVKSVITIPMCNIVRVNESLGEVSIMSYTEHEMLYQSKGKILVKKSYIEELLKRDIEFKITDTFNFIHI